MSNEKHKLSEEELQKLDKLENDGVGFTAPTETVADTKAKQEADEVSQSAKPSLQENLQEKGTRSRTAFVKNQIERYPNNLEFSNFEVKILDLSQEDDLKQFNMLKSQDHNPDYGLTIYKEELRFSEKSDNWKVYLELGLFDFITPFQNINE